MLLASPRCPVPALVGRGFAPCGLDSQGKLYLRIFLDRSVIEVFVNGEVAMAARVYPSRPDSQGIRLFAAGGEARVKTLDTWQMSPIWGNSAGSSISGPTP